MKLLFLISDIDGKQFIFFKTNDVNTYFFILFFKFLNLFNLHWVLYTSHVNIILKPFVVIHSVSVVTPVNRVFSSKNTPEKALLIFVLYIYEWPFCFLDV